jgi:hypothetical protein
MSRMRSGSMVDLRRSVRARASGRRVAEVRPAAGRSYGLRATPQ